jgi:hypothetical protein
LRRRPTAAPSDHHAAGAASATVAEVARLVRLTATHDPRPGDDAGALLCDADLAILAADPAGYDAYAAAVRREYAHLPDEVFRAGRAAVLRSLLGRPALYRVVGERADWEPRARANLTRGAIEAVLSTLAGARPGRRCQECGRFLAAPAVTEIAALLVDPRVSLLVPAHAVDFIQRREGDRSG